MAFEAKLAIEVGLHDRLNCPDSIALPAPYIGPRILSRYHHGARQARPFLYPAMGPENLPMTHACPIEKSAPGELLDISRHKSLSVEFGENSKTARRCRLSLHSWNVRQGRVNNHFLDYITPPPDIHRGLRSAGAVKV